VDRKGKIEILMKEYDTLRQEILSRINNRFLMLGLIGTFLGFALFADNSLLRSYIFGISSRGIVVVIGIVILVATWMWLGYLVGVLAARVSAIEQRVNELAGDELLEWETRHGWGRWGRYVGARKREPQHDAAQDGDSAGASSTPLS
jgi:hypothetical protein